MEKITLVKKKGYAVWASTDERSTAMLSIYQNSSLADAETHDIGWYGADGYVREHTVWQNEETGLIYRLEPYCNGYFKDDEKGQKSARLEEIKAKLSKDELEFLFQNLTISEVVKINQ